MDFDGLTSMATLGRDFELLPATLAKLQYLCIDIPRCPRRLLFAWQLDLLHYWFALSLPEQQTDFKQYLDWRSRSTVLARGSAHTGATRLLGGNLSVEAPHPFCTHALTSRDLGILASLLHGKADKEIAVDLGISLRTVRYYLSRLFIAFGVHGRSELLSVFILQDPH